jgi:hypothetical protein
LGAKINAVLIDDDKLNSKINLDKQKWHNIKIKFMQSKITMAS